MDQVLNILKNLNPSLNHTNRPNPSEGPEFNNNFNNKTKLNNYPYKT